MIPCTQYRNEEFCVAVSDEHKCTTRTLEQFQANGVLELLFLK